MSQAGPDHGRFHPAGASPMRDRAPDGGFEVTEHREPPRTAAEDHSTSSVAPALRGPLALPPPIASRIGPHAFDRRRAIRVLAILSVLVLCTYLGYRAMLALHAWLGEQPAYQVPFASIVLDPPPPGWYRGGSAGFLEDVRRRARMPETVAVLGLEPEELKHVFEQQPLDRGGHQDLVSSTRSERCPEISSARGDRGDRRPQEVRGGQFGGHPGRR